MLTVLSWPGRKRDLPLRHNQYRHRYRNQLKPRGRSMTLSRGLCASALLALIACAGCASPSPKAAGEGVYDVGKLRITLGSGWYEQSGSDLPRSQARSRTWSREGLEHDRLFVTGGVDGGEPMFSANEHAGLPVFQSNMSATETADLVAESLQRVLWNGSAGIAASNVRPASVPAVVRDRRFRRPVLPNPAQLQYNHHFSTGLDFFAPRCFRTYVCSWKDRGQPGWLRQA